MFNTIVLPTRPQPDTIVAIYILKTFGATVFPGIGDAGYKTISQLEEGKTEKDYLKQGMILVDVGGGIFDHHGKAQKTTASALVAEALGILKTPSIQKLLAYAERDDFYGKGTLSDDPLDKTFGLSGLIAALNKTHQDNIAGVVDTVLPLIAAHHTQEQSRVHELPKELEQLRAEGKFEDLDVVQKKNKLRVCFVVSDNVQLPGYLRATDGGKYDVVVQRRSSGHVNIITKPLKRPDLRIAVGHIRAEEIFIEKNIRITDEYPLRVSGREAQTPQWYFDAATNSLQNGGINPNGVQATAIDWNSMKDLILKGLQEVIIPKTPYQQSGTNKILYTAYFVENPQSVLNTFIPRHENVYAHHMTLVYKPESLNGLQVGERALLKVIGRVSDEKGDAVLIDFPRPDGAISHITISCAEGTPPGYSMRLTEKAVAEGAIEELKEPVFIEAIAGYEDGRNRVILKP